MLTRHFLRFNTCLAVTVMCAALMVSRAEATYPVFDSANAALNAQQITKHVQELANQIEQIRNQVQSLQNEAKMLEDLGFSNYNEAVTSMRRIQQLLKKHCVDIDAPVPNAIGYDSGFDCHALIERFRITYPAPPDWTGQSPEAIRQYPDQWNAQKRDAAAHAMQTQNASVESMEGAAQRMAELAAASRNAPGQKAATQVTNEMLVTLSAQLRDQQATAIAIQRAAAVEQAEEAAWYERNKELVRRVSHDARTEYDVRPARSAF